MSHGDLRRRTIHSLFWQFLGVGGQRVVQILGPMVLWRTLDPKDIGLFVILLAGIGVVEALTAFMGEQSSISSERGAETHYLDTVFTVRVLRSIVISGALAALAFPLAWFFGTPETSANYWLPGLFLALAGNGLIDSLQSPARAASMKGMQFRRVALGDFVAAVLGIAATLGFAFLWHDVWALVAGHLASTAMRTVISYASAPYRPRARLDRTVLHELLHYNAGAAGTPFLLLMIFTAPAFVLGKLTKEGTVAVFDGAGRLAKLPEDIFLRVLAPVATPAYAALKNDIPRLARAWSGAVHSFLLIGTPLTVTLAWCGDALPEVVFGAKYVAIPGLFALLAVHGGLAGLTSVVGPLFWAIGQPQWDRKAQFFRCITIYGLGIPGAIWGGPVGFAAATCASILAALWFSLAHALPILRLRLRDLGQEMTDGLRLGLGLGGVLLLLDWWLPLDGWWRLLVAGATGGPLIGYQLLRLLRQRHDVPPTPPSLEEEVADVFV